MKLQYVKNAGVYNNNTLLSSFKPQFVKEPFKYHDFVIATFMVVVVMSYVVQLIMLPTQSDTLINTDTANSLLYSLQESYTTTVKYCIFDNIWDYICWCLFTKS